MDSILELHNKTDKSRRNLILFSVLSILIGHGDITVKQFSFLGNTIEYGKHTIPTVLFFCCLYSLINHIFIIYIENMKTKLKAVETIETETAIRVAKITQIASKFNEKYNSSIISKISSFFVNFKSTDFYETLNTHMENFKHDIHEEEEKDENIHNEIAKNIKFKILALFNEKVSQLSNTREKFINNSSIVAALIALYFTFPTYWFTDLLSTEPIC